MLQKQEIDAVYPNIPPKNLNLQDPSVARIMGLRDFFSKTYKDEPNLAITIRVLECLAFIKLNFPWIKYAIENKAKDDRIFTYKSDKIKQVLRAHNDMSFHIMGYSNAERALSDYASVIILLENNIDLLIDNPIMAKVFINKIKDSDVGCMEHRFGPAGEFLTNPNDYKLHDLFHSFFTEQLRLKIQPNEMVPFVAHLIKYFEARLGEVVTDEKGNIITLNTEVIRNYLESNFEYKDELLPINLLKDAIITKDKGDYLINFADKEIAQHYQNLIKLVLPNNLYKEFKNSRVIQENKNGICYYRFRITTTQFSQVAALLKINGAEVCAPKSLSEILATFKDNIVNKRNDETLKLLTRYPALNDYTFNNEPLLFFAIRHNNLSLVKFLVEKHKVNVNESLSSNKMTPLFLACDVRANDEIVQYLLEKGADPNIACNNGRTPLACAAYRNQLNKVKMLVATGKVDPNVVMDNGHTALINAIQHASKEVVKEILSLPGIDINHKRNDGESALFIAAKFGYTEKVRQLLAVPGIDREAKRPKDSVTAMGVARFNKHPEILEELEIKELEIQTAAELKEKQTYESYVRTLRKVPSNKLYLSYLKDLQKLSNKPGIVTPSEAEQIKARKIWSDVVSETHTYNEQFIKNNPIEKAVIDRLRALGADNPEQLYKDCITYIRDHSTITVSFKAEFLRDDGLVDFQCLNIWEKNNRKNRSDYPTYRENGETEMFSFLTDRLKKDFIKNKYARPRYGALVLMDHKTNPENVPGYGNSFLVLKDVVKLNTLLCPSDSLNYYVNATDLKKTYQVCTIHDLGLLLWQCPDETLKGIISRLQKAEISHNQKKSFGLFGLGGYIEAMLPAVNIFDPNLVEHIHIDPSSYKMSEEEIEAIQKLGISISNGQALPYEEQKKALWNAIKKDDPVVVRSLLQIYPSLAKTSDEQGRLIIHHAAKYGSVKVLNTLVRFGVDLNVNSSDKKTALQIAIEANHLSAIKLLVNEIHYKTQQPKKDILNNALGNNLLCQAISNGRLNHAFYFIENGANMNVINSQGMTPLHCAVLKEQEGLIKQIIKHGAKLTSKNSAGEIPSDLSLSFRLSRNILRQRKNQFVCALLSGDLNTVNEFLNENKDWLNLPLNSQKETALHLAVKMGNLALIKALVDLHHADINIKLDHPDSILDGATPLYFATVRNVQDDIFTYLLSKGADVNIATKSGHTPLSTAVFHNLTGKISSLSQVNSINPNTDCPLIRAIEQGTLDNVKSLLAIPNIDIDKRKSGQSLLVIATKKGDVEKVKLLLSAMVTKEDATTLRSALLVANKMGHKDIAQAIAKVYLPKYIYKISQIPAGTFKAKFNFFGRKDYSPEQLLPAAKALEDVMLNQATKDTLSKFQDELHHGELGLLAKSFRV